MWKIGFVNYIPVLKDNSNTLVLLDLAKPALSRIIDSSMGSYFIVKMSIHLSNVSMVQTPHLRVFISNCDHRIQQTIHEFIEPECGARLRVKT